MTKYINKDEVITALINAVSFFISEDEGVVVDAPGKRYIVGKMKNEIVVSECMMEDADEEFKNVKSGTKIKLTGSVSLMPLPGSH